MSHSVSTKKRLAPIITSVVVGVVTLGLGSYVWYEEHRPAVLEIHVFSMSSGQSMFIRTPNDKRILIDGGPGSDIIAKISAILPFYSRRIDIVMATDDDAKNVGGLIDVINRYDVGSVYVPSITISSSGMVSTSSSVANGEMPINETYATFINTSKSKNIPVNKISASDSIGLDDMVKLRIHFPFTPDKFVYSKTSRPEVLFDLVFGTTSVTFLGSATPKIQKAIATSSTELGRTDVLIISHSALPDSLAPVLINILDPTYLVYSKSTSQSRGTSITSHIKLSSSTSTLRTSKKKPAVDPLAHIHPENRFNLKEGSDVKIVSDGFSLKISNKD